MPKSLFASKTFWGIVATIVSGLAMPVARAIDSRSLSAVEVAQMLIFSVGVITGGGTAIAGRVGAGGVYTPDWLPGPNEKKLN